MSNIVTFEKNLPLKAYQEKDLDAFLATKFKFWIANLLSLKSDKEQGYDASVGAIKKLFWSVGVSEMKKAFEMYALGELGIEPVSNHIDIILVGKIHRAYKDYLRANDNRPKKTEKEIKMEQDILDAISHYNYFLERDKLDENSAWVYTFLNGIGILEDYDDVKIKAFNKAVDTNGYDPLKLSKEQKETCIEIAKKELLLGHFQDFKNGRLNLEKMIIERSKSK